MTDAERRLWQHLRKRQLVGYKFQRQHPFGDYILDFVSFDAKLVVEVDRSQHMDRTELDTKRTRALTRAGFTVLRFWNNQVLNEIESVKEAIWTALQTPPPSQPSP
jgi:very-short-patch-repair endonuclease